MWKQLHILMVIIKFNDKFIFTNGMTIGQGKEELKK